MTTDQLAVILRAIGTIDGWEALSIHDLALQLATPIEVISPVYEPNPNPAPQVPDHAAGFPAGLDDIAALLTADEYLGISKDYPKLWELLEPALLAGDLDAIDRLKNLFAHDDVGLSTASKQALATAIGHTMDDPAHPTMILVTPAELKTPIEIAADLQGIESFAINGDLLEEALNT
jgi:hypothetical protein